MLHHRLIWHAQGASSSSSSGNHGRNTQKKREKNVPSCKQRSLITYNKVQHWTAWNIECLFLFQVNRLLAGNTDAFARELMPHCLCVWMSHKRFFFIVRRRVLGFTLHWSCLLERSTLIIVSISLGVCTLSPRTQQSHSVGLSPLFAFTSFFLFHCCHSYRFTSFAMSLLFVYWMARCDMRRTHSMRI